MISADDSPTKRDVFYALLFAGATALAGGLVDLGVDELRSYLKRQRKQKKI